MKRVLITRPRAQAEDLAEALRLSGFTPVFFPVIEIQPIENNAPMDEAVSKLNSYDWVIFTSVNAVDILFERYPSQLLGVRGDVKFVAIGPKTSKALRAHGITPDFVPQQYI